MGEEDEVSIQEAVEMIAEALEFKGQIHISIQQSNMSAEEKTSRVNVWPGVVGIAIKHHQ